MSSFEVAKKNDESPGMEMVSCQGYAIKIYGENKKTSKPKPKQPEVVKSQIATFRSVYGKNMYTPEI